MDRSSSDGEESSKDFVVERWTLAERERKRERDSNKYILVLAVSLSSSTET